MKHFLNKHNHCDEGRLHDGHSHEEHSRKGCSHAGHPHEELTHAGHSQEGRFHITHSRDGGCRGRHHGHSEQCHSDSSVRAIEEAHASGRCPHCDKHCPTESPECGLGAAFSERLNSPRSHRGAAADDHPHRAERHAAWNEEDSSPDDRILRQLQMTARFLHHHRDEGRGSQQRILTLLGAVESISQRDLLDILDVKAGSLSELVTKLESRGLVARTRSVADKRNVDIALTDAGRAEFSATRDSTGSGASGLLSALTEEERLQLGGLLEKLLGDWASRQPADDRGGCRGGHGFRGGRGPHGGRGH